MVRSLKLMTYKGRPRELSLFKLKRRRFRADLTAVYNYTMEESGEGKAKLFSEVSSDNRRSNRQKSQEGKF